MIKYIIAIICVIIWIMVLRALRRANLKFWRFIVGAGGSFIIGMILLMPLLTGPMSQLVALISSIPGKIAGFYEVYFKYGTILIDTSQGAMSLKIDFECSGIIEVLAFLSLLVFFSVYTITERIWIGILGVIAIIIANSVRVFIICLMIHLGGTAMYYTAHSVIGRIVFYVLSVLLYFYIFTRPQIKRQKVGSFKYDAN